MSRDRGSHLRDADGPIAEDAMFVCALAIDLFIPLSHSLKEKRAVITPILEGLRHRFSVAASEVAVQDKWQRCAIGVAAVGGSSSHVASVLDACEQFVWSFPEIEVTQVTRSWLEP